MSGSIANTTSRLRSRAPAQAATPTRSNAPQDMSWAKTGGAARAAAESEVIKQKEAADRRASGIYMPFRFYLKYPESREVIVLDAQPGLYFYEHQLKNNQTNRWDIYETCPKEFEPCPICSGEVKLEGAGKESYYVMMLTIMDLTPYVKTDKKTGVQTEVPYSRKLLPVKTAEQGFFHRQLDRKGTLRGMHLLMARDTKEITAIGRPEIQMGGDDNPDFNGWHSEAALMESFGSEAVLGQDGKVVRDANIDCFPFEYAKLFNKPDGAKLRQRYNVGGVPGSSHGNNSSFHDDSAHHDHAGHSHTPAVNNPVEDDDIPF